MSLELFFFFRFLLDLPISEGNLTEHTLVENFLFDIFKDRLINNIFLIVVGVSLKVSNLILKFSHVLILCFGNFFQFIQNCILLFFFHSVQYFLHSLFFCLIKAFFHLIVAIIVKLKIVLLPW